MPPPPPHNSRFCFKIFVVQYVWPLFYDNTILPCNFWIGLLFNMTKVTWPTEVDQISVNMTEMTTPTNIITLNLTKNILILYFNWQRLTLPIEFDRKKNYIGHVHLIRLDVVKCNYNIIIFSVKFTVIMFVGVVISVMFTEIWSSSVGHVTLVMLNRLELNFFSPIYFRILSILLSSLFYMTDVTWPTEFDQISVNMTEMTTTTNII